MVLVSLDLSMQHFGLLLAYSLQDCEEVVVVILLRKEGGNILVLKGFS